jgi:DNA repair and recombination protein RAD54B
MDTGCNTHDLLECECDSPSRIPDDFVMETEEELAVEQGFVAASELRQEKLDAADKAVRSCLIEGKVMFTNVKFQYLQKKKAGLAALGEWTHINCLRPSVGSHIQDDILRKIVSISTDGISSEAGNTQLEAILSAVDIDAIRALDKERSVRDVPGGTISFLFEKCSETVLSSSDDENAEL